METSNFQINDIRELDEAVRRLRALSRRYQDFFQLQFQRLSAHMKMQQQMLDRADAVRSMLDDIQSQKDNWESQRLSEMQQIDEAGLKLTNAWQALEQQRRQLLAQIPGANGGAPTNVATNPGPIQSYDPQPMPHPAGQPNQSIPLSGFGRNGHQLDFAAVAAQVQGAPATANGNHMQPQLAAVPTPSHRADEMVKREPKEPVDPEVARFEYEQLKRQMREHANRQG